MTKREAYRQGFDAGHQAAVYCEPASDESCDHTDNVQGTGLCRECLTAEAFESEQGARDYSPWEFIAAEINNGRNPEGQWEAYDAGVAAGIKRGVRERLSASGGR